MSDTPQPVPASVWSGSFRVFGIDVHCHVLDNGERIIEAGSMMRLLQAMASGPPTDDQGDIDAFARWQRGA